MKKFANEIKLICIAILLLIFITYVPNTMVRNWIFILFVFADFYIVAALLKRKTKHHHAVNSVLIGMIILTAVSIVLNRMGF